MLGILLPCCKGQNDSFARSKKLVSVQVRKTDSFCPMPRCTCKDGWNVRSHGNGKRNFPRPIANTYSCGFADCQNSNDRNDRAKIDKHPGRRNGDWFDRLVASDLSTYCGMVGRLDPVRNRRYITLKYRGGNGRVKTLNVFNTRFGNDADNVFRDGTLAPDYISSVYSVDKNSPVEVMCRRQNETVTRSVCDRCEENPIKQTVDKRTDYLRLTNCEPFRSKYNIDQSGANSRFGKSAVADKKQKSDGKPVHDFCNGCSNCATVFTDCVECDRGCSCLTSSFHQGDRHFEIRRICACGCCVAACVTTRNGKKNWNADLRNSMTCKIEESFRSALKVLIWEVLQDMERLRKLKSLKKRGREIIEEADIASVLGHKRYMMGDGFSCRSWDEEIDMASDSNIRKWQGTPISDQ